jgi:DNA-binding HxlR family transcriptional regulator
LPKEKGMSLAELIDEVSDSWLTKELEELDEDGSL